MKKKFLLLFICFLLCLLWGCSKSGTIRVVTGVTVTASNQEQTIQRHFSRDSNISHVLNYLRILDPYTTVQLDPETFRSDSYEIIVTYSDGAYTVYRQLYQDYLQKNNGPWKKIDSRLGVRLQQLMEHLPEE